MLLIENMKLEKHNVIVDGKDYNIILTTFATTLYNDTTNDPSDGADGKKLEIYIIIIDYNHVLQLCKNVYMSKNGNSRTPHGRNKDDR